MNPTQTYLQTLNQIFETGRATEHTYRPALQTYLQTLLPAITASNEEKRLSCGAPDMIISNGKIPIGYIETKDIGKPLNDPKNQEQLQRYLESLDNLIHTDYVEFRFYRHKHHTATIRIADIEGKHLKPHPAAFLQLENLLKDFISYQGQTIKSPKDLAEMMADKARLMRHVFIEALQDTNSSLAQQLSAFKQVLIHDLTAEQFADVYAQTITYGLFTARLHDETQESFSRAESLELIPASNPFLRKLFQYVALELDPRVVWIVDALCDVFRACDVRQILKNFGRASNQRDPFIHFYETFLAAYNPSLRKSRGVWYTPESVVQFIVRAVDDVLTSHFGLKDGLADTSMVMVDVEETTTKNTPQKTSTPVIRTVKTPMHRVQVLDVATGTGTFLAETVRQIHSRFQNQPALWTMYVEQHLLPRLHGFEILMASYAMCHLKLDVLLSELGYTPSKKDNPPRLGVYLSNALEEYHEDVGKLPIFTSWLAKESLEATRIKRDVPVMVAMGNPPYSGVSQNMGEWITNLIDVYKYVDGEHFGERKHWLHDDYVKFIRLGEHYIAKNGEGILAYITNHGYLDNPTFRGMRWHLLNTFEDIYILDLHGNSKKKETAPDGSPDKNVFDIQQGVCIIIAVKTKKKMGILATVHHVDVWGSRDQKNTFLENTPFNKVPFKTLTYSKPSYLFVPQDERLRKNYEQGFSIATLFNLNRDPAPGIVTTHDEYAISDSPFQAQEKIERFLKTTSEMEARQLFKLCSQNQWNYSKAKEALSKDNWRQQIYPIVYRPFDTRFTVYNPHVAVHRRERMTHHFAVGENWGLAICRQQKASDFQHIFVTKNIAESCIVSNKTGEIGYVLPLYLYPTQAPTFGEPQTRTPNLNPDIIKEFERRLGIPFVPDDGGETSA